MKKKKNHRVDKNYRRVDRSKPVNIPVYIFSPPLSLIESAKIKTIKIGEGEGGLW